MPSSPPFDPGDGTAATYGRELLDRLLAGTPAGESPLTHVAALPARHARHTDWPLWAAEPVVRALREHGVPQLWSHQAETADLAANG